MMKKEDKAGQGNPTMVERLVKTSYEMAMNEPTPKDVVYLSAPLCHVFFPYSNPGDDVDFWQRSHGPFHLSIEATRVINPQTHKPERFGLPYGPKPRLMLALLNTVMFKQKSPEIILGNSLTDFVGEHLGLSTDGRTIKEVKNQLARLSTSLITATCEVEDNHSYNDSMKLIRGIDIWWTKNAHQRHLWGNYLRFSDDYFHDIMEHGVPTDQRALSALSGNALALDLYAFLAHRLHVIPFERPLQISWQSMKDQFGQSYGRMDNFKNIFRRTLDMVRVVYRDAKIEEVVNKGFLLYNSKPPVPPNTSIVVPAGLPLPNSIEPFSELYFKHESHVMSERKKDEIERVMEGKWDGQRNAKYKEVKKRKPRVASLEAKIAKLYQGELSNFDEEELKQLTQKERNLFKNLSLR